MRCDRHFKRQLAWPPLRAKSLALHPGHPHLPGAPPGPARSTATQNSHLGPDRETGCPPPRPESPRRRSPPLAPQATPTSAAGATFSPAGSETTVFSAVPPTPPPSGAPRSQESRTRLGSAPTRTGVLASRGQGPHSARLPPELEAQAPPPTLCRWRRDLRDGQLWREGGSAGRAGRGRHFETDSPGELMKA